MSFGVLVTGGNGFVGRALLERLCTPDAGVGLVCATVRAHAVDLPHMVEQVVVPDLARDALPAGALAGIDCVIHLAARAHVLSDRDPDPLRAYRAANVDATTSVARQAARAGVRRFILLSTVKVHGESTEPGHPFTESDVPRSLTDPYALSKLEAERALRTIASETGMEAVIVRPPLVYGPGVKANFALMMRAVASGVPLPLGGIRNSRSLVGVQNLVDFLLVCARHAAAPGQTFLVSDGEDLSTSELLRRLAVAMHRPARLFPVPSWLLAAAARGVGRREVAHRLLDSLAVDSAKARTRLGWIPPLSVDEGLRAAVALHSRAPRQD